MHDLTTDFLSAEPEEREFGLFSDGDYPFTILEINAFETSKAGNDMLPIKLQFKNSAGDTVDCYERLVFTDKAIFKINQFLASVSVPKGTRINFRDDEFIKYLKTKTGTATLGTEDATSKGGKSYKRNFIVAFLYGGSSKRDEVPAHRATPPAHKPAPVEEEEHLDRIPF